MNWPTVLCAACAAGCLSLAAVHVVIWLRDRSAYLHLAFSVLAVSVALFTWGNLLLMLAQSTADVANALWWMNCTIFAMVASLVAFVRVGFRTARPWLGHLAWILRLISLTVNFVRVPGFDYDAITGLRPVDFLGSRIFIAEGVTSWWHWFGQISLATLAIFIVDAAWRLWRSGDALERRRAAVIGSTAASFVIAGAGSAALIFARLVQWPHLEFVGFLGLLAAMAYELSSDVLRAAALARQLERNQAALRETERRMTMAADAGRLGLWIWDIAGNEFWATPRCREAFGVPPDVPITYNVLTASIHADDRDLYASDDRLATSTGGVAQSECRVVLPDGRIRWILMHRRVDLDAAGLPVRLLGICVDLSDQRNAELAARELSGRLITAQEEERQRIARDLHDDISQRLSLISLDLALAARGRREKSALRQLAQQVRDVASEIHRLSHRLHPAKLDQLGLEASIRSWCRDVTQQSGVSVEFVALGVPASLSADVTLCAYRIVQEALQNVVRHSQAKSARVELVAHPGELRLSISDGGCGFAPGHGATTAGLGLLSMRERIRLAGGHLQVDSHPGKGTRIVAAIPVTIPNTAAT